MSADRLFAGLPHATIHEDVYDGYKIPKGATVYANIWYVSPALAMRQDIRAELLPFNSRSLMYDESMYHNPSEFNPERFLPKKLDSGDRRLQTDPCNFAFGFGRRVCPGKPI